MEPSITDWMQAIGVLLGVPLTIWGIFSLFRKDKEKERQLESLKKIAVSQDNVVQKLSEQVDQLAIQSSQFQYQSSLMSESNKLFEKQIELQKDIFMHSVGIEMKKAAIEKEKRNNEIKPFFTFELSHQSPEVFKLILANKGGTALNLKIEEIEIKYALFSPLYKDLKIEQFGHLEIKGTPRPENAFVNGNNITFEINIAFEDIDGNPYYQNIVRLQTGKYIISDPKIKIS